jgi:hypothetical protein
MSSTDGAIVYRFSANSSDLKAGLADIKAQFAQLSDTGKAKSAEIVQAMGGMGAAFSKLTPEVKDLVAQFKNVGATAVLKSELAALQEELKKTAKEFRSTGSTYDSELGKKLKDLSSKVQEAKKQLRYLQTPPEAANTNLNTPALKTHTEAVANLGTKAEQTAAKIRAYGESIGNAAYEYGPWTGAHVQAAQVIGTTLVEAMAKANLAAKALSLGLTGIGVALGASLLVVAVAGGRLRDLQDTASALSVSIQSLKDLGTAGAGLGIDAKTMNTEMTGFAKKVREAAVAGGDLADFLEKNNIKIKDSQGNLRPVQQIFGDIGSLIKADGNELDKLAALDKLGFGADMLRMFERGSDAVKQFADTAVTTQDDTNNKLARYYEELSQVWHSTMESLGNAAISMSYSVLSTVGDMMHKIEAFFTQAIAQVRSQIASLTGDMSAAQKFANDATAAANAERQRQMAQDVKDGNANYLGKLYDPKTGDEVKGTPQMTVRGSGAPSIKGLYDKDSGAGSKAKSPTDDAKDSIERYIDSLKKANETAKAEAETWNLSNVERAKAVALAQATAAADRDGLTLSAKQKEQVAALAVQTQNLKDKTDGLKASSQALGEAFTSALDQLIVKGGKLNDVMKSLLQNMASAILKGALMGEGSFGSIFGGAAGSGGIIGGALKSVFSGFKAEGGPVMGGKAYVVGENGPELFAPNGGGSIIPNGGNGSGGNSGGNHININLAGANGDATIAKIVTQAVQAGLGQFSSQVLPGRINEIQMRGA